MPFKTNKLWESSIIRSVGQNKEYAESALAVATRALASADGKNTVCMAQPNQDEPAINRGVILCLTAGEETENVYLERFRVGA